MKITIAKDAGYCFGVRDAVNMAYDTSKEQGDVYMLGDIVHNEKVVEDLSKVGTKVVNSINDIPNDKPVLFRAHGTSQKIWKEAQDKNIDIIDATCPLVKEIHEEVEKLEKDGRQIFIIGDHGHDEVVGIESHAKKPIVISNIEEAKKLRRYKRAGVVSQSTQTIENVQKIINILMIKVYDLHFINTICFPTKRNQNQIKELAQNNDLMIIIGSFTSANSKRLTELSLEINPNTFQVNGAKGLKQNWFSNVKSVGISAGASTPDYLIDEVQNEIKKFSKNKKGD
tara:strand:- start:447 stop:1298 length:852 start_codon:yes stop_codon:yes gene_type:complete